MVRMETGNMVLHIILSGMKAYRRENTNLYCRLPMSGNEFNGPEKILLINISPAFWNTWWFRIIALILYVGDLLCSVRWRTATKIPIASWNVLKKKNNWLKFDKKMQNCCNKKQKWKCRLCVHR